jgi:hypothetical protein
MKALCLIGFLVREYLSSISSEDSCVSASMLQAHARQLKDTVERLAAMRMDHTEYTCLKAILLFRPGTRGPKLVCACQELRQTVFE